MKKTQRCVHTGILGKRSLRSEELASLSPRKDNKLSIIRLFMDLDLFVCLFWKVTKGGDPVWNLA